MIPPPGPSPCDSPTLPPSQPSRPQPDAATLAPSGPLAPAPDQAAAEAPTEPAQREPALLSSAVVVPGYQVLGLLGKGGMGVVYKARHQALGRTVALKMILHAEHAGSDERGRFLAEAQAVASLQHANVVQVYEVGQHGDLPYFSLELCSGGSLADRLDGTPWESKHAATLIETLARAMHTAHLHGIVHRDLKPANILLTEDGTPKVTDFGLAKRIDSQGATRTGAVMGTPSYMAPEQASGKKDLGPPADVYALGAILYELLTGRPPFRAATPLDTVLQVISEEPVPPSRLQPKVPRDAETICLKCLAKEPARRYADAAALAEDLRRFLQDEPILARPIGAWERAWKWARRRPALATLAVVSLLAAISLLAGGVYYNARVQEALSEAQQQRQAATEASAQAQAERTAAITANAEADRLRGEAVQIKADADAQRRRAKQLENTTRRNLYFMQLAAARRAFDDAQIEQAIDHLQSVRPLRKGDADLRGFEWYYLWDQCHADLLTFHGHAGQVSALAISPDGTRLASAAQDGVIKLWDATTGRELLVLRGHTEIVRKLAFRPDGLRLASASGDGTARTWDMTTGQQELLFGGHTGELWCVAYSPDGKRVASTGADRMIRIWDGTTGREQRSIRAHDASIGSVSFSPNGKQLVSGGDDSQVKLWDAGTGKNLASFSGQNGHPWCVVFSPDGDQLASASLDGAIRVWDTDQPRGPRRALRGHSGPVYSVAFSPDGKSLASAGNDRTIRLWEVSNGQERFVLRGHTGAVWPVAFSPDGKRLASGSADQSVKLWDVTHGPDAQTFAGQTSVAFSPDGKRLVSPRGLGIFSRPQIMNAETGAVERSLVGHSQEVVGVAFSRDGKLLATTSKDMTVRVWAADTGSPLMVFQGHKALPWGVAFSPDGTRLVSGGQDGVVKVWDVTLARTAKGDAKKFSARVSDQALHTFTGHRGAVMNVAFSPDGQLVASAGLDGTVGIWDAAAGKNLRFLVGHRGQVLGVAFHPDGKVLASGGIDSTVKLWDIQSPGQGHTAGAELRTLTGHTRYVWSVAFSPDGKRLASVSGDGREQAGETKVWDTDSGLELLTLRGHTSPITGVAFSPDGQRLATATIGFRPAVKVWGKGLAPTPSTDDWPVVFADDFHRPELGDTWKTDKGRWSLADGALRGEPPAGGVGKEPVAVIGLQRDLPATVEVKVDCWASSSPIFAIALASDRSGLGTVGFVSGLTTPFRGACFSVKHGARGENYIAQNSSITLQPAQRYHLRLLREPGRLSLFVDDALVSSTPFTAGEAPRLYLVGVQGPAGASVNFANFEVRAPAGAMRERALRTRVETLCDQLLARSAVADQLKQDKALSPPDRELALRLVEEHQERPEPLLDASWETVKEQGRQRAAYELALHQAQAACRLMPDKERPLILLGLAQFRVGLCEEALATLGRAEGLYRARFGSSSPTHLAFMALAHHRLGHAELARNFAVRLRDLLRSESWAREEQTQRFRREVEDRIGRPVAQPSEAREEEAIKDVVFGAEDAVWSRHDLAGYLRSRADEVREVMGRGEQAEPSDVVLDRAKLEAVRRVQFQPPVAIGLRASFENVQGEVNGDQAVLRWDGTTRIDEWFKTWRVVARLRKTPQGWRLFSVRGWPLAERSMGRLITYDAAHWKEKDAAVVKARAAGDLRALARALMEAERPTEAHAAARDLTAMAGATAADWSERGDAALHAGDVADALASFHKAQALDPEVALPYYMVRVVRQFFAGGVGALGISYRRDGERLATSWSDGTVRVWATSGDLVRKWAAHTGGTTDVVYSPDGKCLDTAGSEDPTVRLWDAERGMELHVCTGHTKMIYRLHFSPDGRRVVSASADRTARVWDIHTGKHVTTLEGHQGDVLGAVFSPDGKTIATASMDNTARIWDERTGQELQTLRGHSAGLIRVAFRADGKQLLSCGYDKTIKVWDTTTWKEVRTLAGHKAAIQTALFSPDGQHIASASEDGNIKLWDAQTGKKLRSIPAHNLPIWFLVFSPDSKHLASSSPDGTVRIWDVSPQGPANKAGAD